jgi:FkbM family methyltransferase
MLLRFLRRELRRGRGADAPAQAVSALPKQALAEPSALAAAEPQAQFELGMAHHHARRTADAEACYRQVLAAQPDHAAALYHLALILCADGRLTEAARLAARAHALQPSSQDYMACARYAFCNCGTEQDAAVGSSTDDAAAWCAAGNRHRHQRAFAEAEAAYRRAIAAEPANVFAQSRLGNLLATLGRCDEAQPHFGAAAAAGLSPDALVRLDAAFFDGLRAQPPIPAPAGDWGGPTARRAVIFIAGDQAYFDRFAYALVNSLLANGRADCLVHIHVVNPADDIEARVAAMRAKLNCADIALSHERVDLAPGETARIYYACARFLHLPELARRYARPVLVLDLDMLVIKPIEGLLDALASCDAALIEYDRGRNDVGEHFSAAVVYCGTAPPGPAFFDDVARYIAHFLRSGQPAWFLDQVALFASHAQAASPRLGTQPPRLQLLAGTLFQTSLTPESGRLDASQDNPALFWSVTYSVPENAGKLELPEFRRYTEREEYSSQAVADFNRVKPCRHGLMMYNINDRYIGGALHHYGEFSQGEIDLFAKIVAPGQTVVDAGANIGAHTVWFCRAVGPGGRVHAFEPQRVIFQALCGNLALNSFQNAHAHHAALGERNGSIRVDTPDYSLENNFGGMPLGQWGAGEEVPLTRIDALALENCHFIKIDVEGMEQAVIAGAARTIARHRPVLYVENDRPENAAALIAQLRALDYSLYWHCPPYFNPDNFARNPVNRFGDIASRNMLCLPRERALEPLAAGLAGVEMPPAKVHSHG